MPFRVVYGCDPPPLIPYQPDSAKVAAIDRQLGDRDVFLADVKEYLLHAQELMRSHYDGHHRDVQFVMGDCVWLRLHQRMAATLKDKAASKLTPRFYGPFRVEARIGPVAYRLQLPPPPPAFIRSSMLSSLRSLSATCRQRLCSCPNEEWQGPSCSCPCVEGTS